jgi:hypothetical protein
VMHQILCSILLNFVVEKSHIQLSFQLLLEPDDFLIDIRQSFILLSVSVILIQVVFSKFIKILLPVIP